MNWKIKAHGLAALSRVYKGRQAYHRLQSLLRTNRVDPDESLRRSLEIVQLIREAGADVPGRSFIEIGTGWRPFLPFLLALLDAERVLTLDINPWLTKEYALETVQAISDRLPSIAATVGMDSAALTGRIKNAVGSGRSLAEILKAFRVEYRCPGDARATGLQDRSIDFVCSSNVLEHVDEKALADIHRESVRILKSDGLAVHRFNPEDHFAAVDQRITRVNFLQFSRRQWRWYGGSGLSYHNRVRCRQHADLFAEAGFSIIINRVRIDNRSVESIRSGQLGVHPDFAGLSPEELAADYMWLVGAPNRTECVVSRNGT